MYCVHAHGIVFRAPGVGTYIDKVTRGTTQHCYMRDNDDDKTGPATHVGRETNHPPHNVGEEGWVAGVEGRGGWGVHVDGGR